MFPLALLVSGIYWRTRKVKGGLHLNDLADQNDFQGVTRNINGKRMLALADRTALTKRAYALLQADRTYGPRTDAGSSGSGSVSNDDDDGSSSSDTGNLPRIHDPDPADLSNTNAVSTPDLSHVDLDSVELATGEDQIAPGSAEFGADFSEEPEAVSGRYVSYIYNHIAHYSDGTEDLAPNWDTMPTPAPSRRVAYFLNGQIVNSNKPVNTPRLLIEVPYRWLRVIRSQ